MPVSSAVVGDVNAKVPVELPLKGNELEAKAIGDTETTAMSVRMIVGRILKEGTKVVGLLNKVNSGWLGSDRFSGYWTRRERICRPS